MNKNFTKLLLVSGSVLFLCSQSVEAMMRNGPATDPETTSYQRQGHKNPLQHTQDKERAMLMELNPQLKKEICKGSERHGNLRRLYVVAEVYKLYVVAEVYNLSAKAVKDLSLDELNKKYEFAKKFIPENLALKKTSTVPLTYQQAEQLILMSREANESTER